MHNVNDEQWEPCPSGLIGEMAEGLRTAQAQRQMLRSLATAAAFLFLFLGGAAITSKGIDFFNQSSEPLTCREVIDLLADYREGLLSKANWARVHDHLKLCPSCLGVYEKEAQHLPETEKQFRESPLSVEEESVASLR